MRFEKWIRDWKTALAENFFLRSLCLLLALGLILNASFFKKRERIIIVPPELSKQFWEIDLRSHLQNSAISFLQGIRTHF